MTEIPAFTLKCRHKSSARADLATRLPEFQGSAGRHKCAICAYSRGYEDGVGGKEFIPGEVCGHSSGAPKAVLDALPNSQSYPVRHLCAVCAYTMGHRDGKANRITAKTHVDAILAEEGALPVSSNEGERVQRLVNTYERDARLRAEAVRIHGTVCKVCGFDFQKVYGSHGEGYIEVHHLKPLSDGGGPKDVDPKTDLTVLCSNCHRMIHRHKDNVLTPGQLSKMMKYSQE